MAPVHPRRARGLALIATAGMVALLALPASARPTEVLWAADFTGADPHAALRAEVEDGAANLSFVRPAHTPDTVVYRAHVDAGERNGHKWRARFSDAAGARGAHLGVGARREVYLSYDVWIPSTASVDSADLKLPGIGGLPDGQTGWATASGGNQRTDSWSLRVHTRHPRRSHFGQPRPERFLEAYLYAQQAGGKRGADHAWGMAFPLTTTGRETGASLPFELDRWNRIELRAKMHTGGRADGIVEVWLNGVRGVSLTDVRFTADDEPRITQLVAETFYNAPGATADHAIDLARMQLRSGPRGMAD